MSQCIETVVSKRVEITGLRPRRVEETDIFDVEMNGAPRKRPRSTNMHGLSSPSLVVGRPHLHAKAARGEAAYDGSRDAGSSPHSEEVSLSDMLAGCIRHRVSENDLGNDVF